MISTKINVVIILPAMATYPLCPPGGPIVATKAACWFLTSKVLSGKGWQIGQTIGVLPHRFLAARPSLIGLALAIEKYTIILWHYTVKWFDLGKPSIWDNFMLKNFSCRNYMERRFHTWFLYLTMLLYQQCDFIQLSRAPSSLMGIQLYL